MSATPRSPAPRRWTLVLAGVAAASLLLGVAFGVAVIGASTESASGDLVPTSLLNWLLISSVRSDTIPTVVPIGLSTNPSIPTILPTGNTSFHLAAATAGHTAVRWDLELTSPPVNTEVELTFEVVNATTGVVNSRTVYFETNATAPPIIPVVTVYWDQGTGAVVLAGETTIAQECRSIGNCP